MHGSSYLCKEAACLLCDCMLEKEGWLVRWCSCELTSCQRFPRRLFSTFCWASHCSSLSAALSCFVPLKSNKNNMHCFYTSDVVVKIHKPVNIQNPPAKECSSLNRCMASASTSRLLPTQNIKNKSLKMVPAGSPGRSHCHSPGSPGR